MGERRRDEAVLAEMHELPVGTHAEVNWGQPLAQVTETLT